MKLKSGTPYSLLKTITELKVCDDPKRKSRSQVIVVGTGISGTLIGHALLEAGYDVCLLDKRPPSTGSTPAATGMLQYELDASAEELVERIGHATWKRVVHTMREANSVLGKLADHFPASGFEKRDSLYIASQSRDVTKLRTEFDFRQEALLPVEWLNREILKKRFEVQGNAAILSRGAAKIDAYALSLGLLKNGQERGLKIYSPIKVIAYRDKDNGVEVETDSGTMDCDHLVLANGYEGYGHLKQRTFDLTYSFATLIRPAAPLATDMPLIWETARPYCYMRGTSTGHLMAGGEDEPFVGQRINEYTRRKKQIALMRKTKELTGISGTPVTTWAGVFIASKDSLPFIGRIPGSKRVFAALAYGANGITFSEIGASMILEMIQGGNHPLEGCFALDRSF